MKLRVAFVQSHLFFGSVESYLSSLIAGLDPERYEPWLILPDRDELAPLRELEAVAGRTVSVPAVSGLVSLVRTRRRAIRRADPDLVHCADFDPPAMLAARLAGVRRIAVTYNTPELRPDYNLLGRLTARTAWGAQPWTILTSAGDRETAIERDPIDPRRTAVIPYGFAVDCFAPRGGRVEARALLGIAPDRTVIGTVGLLREQKGHTYLLQALELLLPARDDLELVIVGDGPMRSALEDEVRVRGLEGRVHLPGLREDVPELLEAFDVFALSSTFEGMCYAVAEALAAELPVVATNVGGVPQSVVDGATGLLEPARDPAALAAAIARLLDDPAEARRLAAAGRARMRELYALEEMVARTQELYERMAGTAS